MSISNLNDKDLIKLAMDIYDSIYVIESYSIADIAYLNTIILECENRGLDLPFNEGF